LGGLFSLPRGCAGLPQAWLREFCMTHGTHMFGLLSVSQAGLEPAVSAAVAVAVLKFSHCNMLCGSFPQARGSGDQWFHSSWCFISAKCGSSVSGRFWNQWA
jgi:hypothetical protein